MAQECDCHRIEAEINAKHHAEIGDPEIQTTIAQQEMAFRMQSSVPELTDISNEKWIPRAQPGRFIDRIEYKWMEWLGHRRLGGGMGARTGKVELPCRIPPDRVVGRRPLWWHARQNARQRAEIGACRQPLRLQGVGIECQH